MHPTVKGDSRASRNMLT